MREYTNEAKLDEEILQNFSLLIDKTSSSSTYSKALEKLGNKLAGFINPKIKDSKKIVFACSTEDADWLGKGIIDRLEIKDLSVAIFWNFRTQAINDKNLIIAPIIKTYIEDIKSSDTLIICKSIIYTSCVVRTNLTYLINEINPKKIIIVSPVLFKSAKESLSKEFDHSISSKFDFVYFAVDDKVTPEGEVIPGIGGNIYNRLGFSDIVNKNKYIPELVKDRRENQYR